MMPAGLLKIFATVQSANVYEMPLFWFWDIVLISGIQILTSKQVYKYELNEDQLYMKIHVHIYVLYSLL